MNERPSMFRTLHKLLSLTWLSIPAVCIRTERRLDDLKVAPFSIYVRDMAGVFVERGCRPKSDGVCRINLHLSRLRKAANNMDILRGDN